MDSILDIEQQEVERIQEIIKENIDLFRKNSADLFEDAFHVLTSAGAKIENFKILRKLQAVSQSENGDDNEDTNEATQ